MKSNDFNLNLTAIHPVTASVFMTLQGKVALVTGGSGALGAVHALSLAKAGCHVAVTGHSHIEKAEGLVKEIEKLGRKALAVQADVSDLDAVSG